MKSLVVYDTLYGNTEKVAKAISLGIRGDVNVSSIGAVDEKDLVNIDLLVVGSPVHGGRPTPEIDEFLNDLSDDALKGIRVTSFDTRFAPQDHGIGLRILMKVIRFAAERMDKMLQKKGGILITKGEGFIVENKSGPLKNGELDRAVLWGKELGEKVKDLVS